MTVECWEAPMNWRRVWAHQLRWARTIRVCQPAPYFFSILSNATLWPLLLLLFGQAGPAATWSVPDFLLANTSYSVEVSLDWTCIILVACLTARVTTSLFMHRRLENSSAHFAYFWLVPLKDLLAVAVWALAFAGNRVVWRGQCFRVLAGGRLEKK